MMSKGNISLQLFWLVTETYAKEEGSVKDLKKWAYEIFSTFLAQTAVSIAMSSCPMMHIYFCVHVG